MSRMFKLPDGRIVNAWTQFRIKDQVYPAGWLHTASEKELDAIGVVIEDIPDDPPPPPPPPSTKVDGLTFLKRLTPEEYAAVVTAADQALATGNPQLAMWLDMVRVNAGVDVAGPDATQARAFLVAAKLLTEARAERVFALPGTVFPPDPEPAPEPTPDPEPAPTPEPTDPQPQ